MALGSGIDRDVKRFYFRKCEKCYIDRKNMNAWKGGEIFFEVATLAVLQFKANLTDKRITHGGLRKEKKSYYLIQIP